MEIDCWKCGEEYRFDSKQELAIFRTIQELLNNSIKHSSATLIKIDMRFSAELLSVVFSDNGIGFKLNEIKEAGLGLRNLENRTQLVGAKFKMKSVIDRGTTAIICLSKKDRELEKEN